LVYRLKDPPLKAGEYRFSGPAATPEVLERLIRGEVVTHAVTLVEGWTLEETARHLADQGFGDYDALLWEMSSPAEIADLDAEAPDLEGYLFPDTYSFARGTPEREIVTALVANFRRRYEGEIRPLLGPDDGRSVRQIVTLASVVEKEAQLDEERPLIAGVYANRLERGIALYADPTVIYALKKLGRWDGNLRRPDLEIDSPYNTYRYPGLPPGPIASPGLASLKAAAQPADVSYLFFVSRNDGSHVFAATLAEHNRNVYKWQKVYWRQRWAEKKSAGGG
ncbi:MAG: endolytic transglycosylase MltG, partial [Thermoanaerobaculia bacterium]